IDACFRLFGDQILISHPFDDAWPMMINKYDMQWSGAAPWHNMQTADDQRQVRMFNLIREGSMDEANALYWQSDPLRKAIMSIAMPSALLGMYNFDQWKYCDELFGLTGGEMRMPKMMLHPPQKQMLTQAMIAAGFKPVSA
ncbi:MAG: hypothetical protein GXP16_19525, partial [Gammaproteobacteria bacterium]|nr:hypothetical protein [Gammaproteobacteria bacterium]